MASSSNLWTNGSPELPSVVIKEKILERIPIEDEIPFKCICKALYGLVKEKRFIFKHLNLSKKRFIQIYLDNFQIINPVTLNILYLPVPSEFLMGKTAKSLCYISLIHCDGLLLCRCDLGRSNPKLAIWNPVLNSRVKWIEPSHPYNSYDAYGLKCIFFFFFC